MPKAKIQNSPVNFSPHLFWDVDASTLTWKTNLNFIVQRVLEYGLLSDWQILVGEIGIEKVGMAAASLRDLDDRAMWFIAALTNLPVEKFRCFTSKQSSPPHWNF